jgi:hypothetical protein
MKNEVFICSVVLGAILWLVNAAFNFAAKDYRALGVNIAYIICLISMAGAFFAGNMSVVQGMIGALMMACVWGNVNVLTEMLDADIPSRSLWQVALGAALTMVLFINHFLISREKTRTLWRIKVNQIIIMLIIILRTYQIIINILAGGFTPLVIEITVGLLAIIPTLDAIASIEAKTDAYVAKN